VVGNPQNIVLKSNEATFLPNIINIHQNLAVIAKTTGVSFLCGHTRLTVIFLGLPPLSRYQKGKTNLDFTEARDSEWQWHQLGHVQVCTSLQTDYHTSTTSLSFLQDGCPSCRPTNSVEAVKAVLRFYLDTVYKNTSVKTISYCNVCMCNACQHQWTIPLSASASLTLLDLRVSTNLFTLASVDRELSENVDISDDALLMLLNESSRSSQQLLARWLL